MLGAFQMPVSCLTAGACGVRAHSRCDTGARHAAACNHVQGATGGRGQSPLPLSGQPPHAMHAARRTSEPEWSAVSLLRAMRNTRTALQWPACAPLAKAPNHPAHRRSL